MPGPNRLVAACFFLPPGAPPAFSFSAHRGQSQWRLGHRPPLCCLPPPDRSPPRTWKDTADLASPDSASSAAGMTEMVAGFGGLCPVSSSDDGGGGSGCSVTEAASSIFSRQSSSSSSSSSLEELQPPVILERLLSMVLFSRFFPLRSVDHGNGSSLSESVETRSISSTSLLSVESALKHKQP